MTEQSRRQRKETERMGIVIEHTERGREQAGMSREGQRTMEKVLENKVHDINLKRHNIERTDLFGHLMNSPAFQNDIRPLIEEYRQRIRRNEPYDRRPECYDFE